MHGTDKFDAAQSLVGQPSTNTQPRELSVLQYLLRGPIDSLCRSKMWEGKGTTGKSDGGGNWSIVARNILLGKIRDVNQSKI